ncbi:hypothetical protein [Edwardsiella tarda]|uniref:hypothetical protein n=1 Tax=Edwardsiella tarda TaxID=636 RepID=UPI000555EF10|nr:hypothetical protein [Edwardsiella tarda]
MTPTELLGTVKDRFPTLIYDDEQGLAALLEQALGTYQDKAGVIKTIKLNSNSETIPLPDDFLSLVGVKDAASRFIISEVYGKELELELYGTECMPFRFQYLAKLRGMNPDDFELPDEAIGLLSNYLEVLISIPNMDFVRRVSIAGKFDASNLPDENTLYERKKTLEQEMEASRAIIPMVCLD